MNDYLDYYEFEQIQELYNYQEFTPFADPTDKRSVRDLTYLICREKPELYKKALESSPIRKKFRDDCIEVYAPLGDGSYACVAYADFHYEKIKNDRDIIKVFPQYENTLQLKLDYIHTAEPYRGLGLASMMIALLQDECRLKNVPIFRLDSLRDYVFTEDGVIDKNDTMYRGKGFLDIPGDYSKENVKPKFLLITQVQSAQELAQTPQYQQLVNPEPADYGQEYSDYDGQIISFDEPDEEEYFVDYINEDPALVSDDLPKPKPPVDPTPQ